MTKQRKLAEWILDGSPTSSVPSNAALSHAYPSGPSSTSTFRVSVSQQTREARGRGGDYNPYITPYQHWLLKKHENPDTQNPAVREDLYYASQLLKKHTRDMIWRIVANSWIYERDGTEIMKEVKWSPELQDMYIDALAKAMIIDTSFLVRWSNGSFSVFTHNQVHGNVYVSREDRQIEEVYLQYPRLERAIYRDNLENDEVIIGFLTQHAMDASAPSRVGDTSVIYKDCVVFQPVRDTKDVFGIPYLSIENETAVQKIYLRSYQFAFVHKGGVNQVIAVPFGGAKSDLKDKIVRNVANGLWSRGLVMEVEMKGDRGMEDLVLAHDIAVPELGFDRINSMISEDAQLSKQRIEGTAETGALGGQAPVVNQQEDLIQLDSLLVMMDKAIRDVNEVFFGIKAYEDKIFNADGQTNVIKMPAYDIVFMRPEPLPPEDETTEDMNMENQKLADPPVSKSFRGPTRRPRREQAKAATPGKATMNSVMWMEPISAKEIEHAVEINGVEYTVYEGNLFDNVPYYYPETDTFDQWDPRDIENFTKNPVNRAPIALTHDDPYYDVGLDKGKGFLEIMGYDQENKRDRTRFYIPSSEDIKLRQEGIIQDNTIKVSPLFHSKPMEDGRKLIYLKNGAIIDPRKTRPRAELTGGSTSAKLQEE